MKTLESEDSSKKRLRWHKRLNEGILSKQLLLGALFVIALALFLQFREVRMEVLDLNTTADRYVVTQVDFEFPDEEATLILKQEAVRDIGAIYQIEEPEIRERRFAFENGLVKDQSWREKLPSVSFEQLYKGADAIEATLLQSRFADLRTVEKIESLKIDTTAYTVLSSKNESLPEAFWGHVKQTTFPPGKYSEEAVDYLMHYFSGQRWNLEEDAVTERMLRQKVQEGVSTQYTRVEAGTRIIHPGEKVTQRHVAMQRAMKQALGESRNMWEPLTLLGSLLLSLIFTILAVAYFRFKHPNLLYSLQRLGLIITIILVTLFLSKLTEYFLLNRTTNLIDAVRYPLFVPFASILICVLVGAEAAWFVSAFLAIVLGVSLAVEHNRFLVINLIAGLITILCARGLHKRKEVFVVCAKVWLCCIPILLAFNLSQNIFWDLDLVEDLSTTFIFMAATAILVAGLLPVLELFFDAITDMTLMEHMDPNNELLRRLSLEAPGTYQHCLVLGNLAEAAALAIGANGLFCRVATLYHDIGKLFNPHYFTENQLGGFNIHQLLTPAESAQVIIAHVAEGEALARRYRLPGAFIDIIREHHGTTLVYYFYSKQVDQMGGNPSKVDEQKFRYPGPKPHSKESAIIMIADTIEAASRSMDELTEESIAQLVDRLVIEKAEDGQFDQCQITFEELSIVKKTIVKTLSVTRHLRIKYPARRPNA